MADALLRTTNAAEYKHVVLALISLNYISGLFEERLVVEMHHQQAETARLNAAIALNLDSLGFCPDLK